MALALDHLRAGRKDEAFETLRAALRENADNVDALRVLAQLYWREDKQLSDAEALLRRVDAARARPHDGLDDAGRHPAGIESPCRGHGVLPARRSGLDPASAVAWSGLGIAYSHAGDVGKAIEAFERSIALRP